jgi:hypothetical protein
METIRAAQRKYGSRSMSTAIVIGMVFFLLGHTAVTKGLVLGTLFSVVNFVLMGETLPLKLGRDRRRTFLMSLVSLAIRYLLLAVPLVIAVKSVNFHLPATIVGVFMVQLMIFVEQLFRILPVNRNKSVQGRHTHG